MKSSPPRRRRPAKPARPARVHFCLRTELYNYRFVFVLGDMPDVLTFARICGKYGLERDHDRSPYSPPAQAEATTSRFANGSLVWLPATYPAPEFFDCLVHELTHVLSNFLDWMGSDIIRSADEPIAYLLGWLAREVAVRSAPGRTKR